MLRIEVKIFHDQQAQKVTELAPEDKGPLREKTLKHQEIQIRNIKILRKGKKFRPLKVEGERSLSRKITATSEKFGQLIRKTEIPTRIGSEDHEKDE